jgi:hypothetical protein
LTLRKNHSTKPTPPSSNQMDRKFLGFKIL